MTNLVLAVTCGRWLTWQSLKMVCGYSCVQRLLQASISLFLLMQALMELYRTPGCSMHCHIRLCAGS